MNTPLLSILIPSVPSRLDRLAKLIAKLEDQAGQLEKGVVEILALTDNKARSVGLKRQALLDVSRGDYVAFCDDDDIPTADYLELLVAGAARGMDVVTFRQACHVNGQVGMVHFSLANKQDEPFKPGETIKRRPWHVCAWRRSLAIQGIFTDKMWGEDCDWVDQVVPLARTESHVNRILHTYVYDSAVSEAPFGDSMRGCQNEKADRRAEDTQ